MIDEYINTCQSITYDIYLGEDASKQEDFDAPAGRTSLTDPIVMLAALEAMIGLLVEVSFIATFTQRFFGK